MDATQRQAQRQRLEEEAARLVVDQARPGDPAAEADLLHWAAQSPAHGVALAQAQAAWASAERLRALPPAPAYRPPRLAMPRPSRRALLAGGAAATIIGGFSASLWWQGEGDHFATAIGERRSIALADGSHLHLNTDTALDVALHADRRTVRLIRGEAMFDIARDVLRPFLVTTGSTTLRVLGTAFNVRMREDLVELVVAHGLVGVEDAGMGLRKVAGGHGAAIHGRLVAVTALAHGALAQRIAWQDGVIDFDGRTLSEAVAEFNRYLPHPIVIADPDLASIRLGGVFPTGESDKFLDALESSFAIKAIKTSDQSVLLIKSGSAEPVHPI